MSNKKDPAIKYPPPGIMVKVGEAIMHVYQEGEGSPTLIFLAGHATATPFFDFKPLWSLLSNKYHIAVPERAGYGWSHISKKARAIDTVLNDTRESLKIADIPPPYILVPHSIAGIEALYWAQKYPDEVQAIIGLDPSLPEPLSRLKIPLGHKLRMTFMSFALRRGMTKDIVPNVVLKMPSYELQNLSDEDRDIYLEIVQQRYWSKDVLREMDAFSAQAKTVLSRPMPLDTPIMLITSDPEKTPRMRATGDAITQLYRDFLMPFKHKNHIELGCGHFIHAEAPERCAEAITEFIGALS